MPQWLPKLFNTNYNPRWSDEQLEKSTSLNVMTEKSLPPSSVNGTRTPTTSTAFEHSLPPPAVQSSTASMHTRRTQKKKARVGGLTVHWARFKKRIGTGTAPSSSSLIGESAAEHSYTRRMETAQEENDNVVDEVVVDRVWSEEIKSSVSHSEHGGSPEKSGGSHQLYQGASDRESVVVDGFWSLWTPLVIIRYRTWPLLMEIFSSRFVDEKSEQHYEQESWFLKKSLALWASLWLICNWVLGCIFIPHNPIVLVDKVFYFGIAPFLSLPVVFMVMYDWPRDRPNIYQVFLVVSSWCWSFYQVIFLLICDYYSLPSGKNSCGNRDFLGLFYYTSAMQTIALFGLKLNRFTAALGALTFFLFASIAIIPLRKTWGRSMINFFFFHSFLIYVHYMRESSERRLYTLRDQLKIQYKATQKAQINERKASDSKRRLTSYVFHDVRVPLNTALLAVQNMEASGTVVKDQEIEFNALCGSLGMMSKVLNDVLDFNRMDSGKFESASRPYAFHHVMRSLFIPLRLATDARGLKFETDLDPYIDQMARKAAYEAMGEGAVAIRQHMKGHPNVDGVVTGDETRLRQIITNLASNACKFTPAGGKLSIKTRLVVPSVPNDLDLTDICDPDGEKLDMFGQIPDLESANGQGNHSPVDEDEDSHGSVAEKARPLSTDLLTEHNRQHGKPPTPLEWIVVRIEVSDTGYGIKPQDMAQTKLFSAFNQTEQGRQQGGKGTGLGLALVRQIVKLSGGRLGVRSKAGEGSTFWVEMPLGVGSKTFISGPPDLPDSSSGSDLETLQRRANIRLKSRENLPRITDMPGVDAAGLRASMAPPVSTAQTNAAMQGIMEQGGRVDLVLRKQYAHSESTPPIQPVDDPLAKAGMEQAGSTKADPLRPLCNPISYNNSNPGELPDSQATLKLEHRLEVNTNITSVPESSRPTPIQRPTYVKLPSPQKFAHGEDHYSLPNEPPSSYSNLSNSTSSERSMSNLKMFDNNFTRGSPSASFTTLNIEPGMPVLVVDDDMLTRTLMKRVLTRLGCQVSCAENGEVALEMILGQKITMGTTPGSETSGNAGPILEQQSHPAYDEGKYAVVFLDNQMPVMSGLKAVERLRELDRNDFIVGVTGNALLSDQQEYLEAGVNRVLTKPVLERNLRDILVEADEKRKMSRTVLEPPS